jgi:hypothetical protein
MDPSCADAHKGLLATIDEVTAAKAARCTEKAEVSRDNSPKLWWSVDFLVGRGRAAANSPISVESFSQSVIR